MLSEISVQYIAYILGVLDEIFTVNAVLQNFYSGQLLVRLPAPVTVNKAGANYKSEVKHLEYSPQEAFDEWLAICDAIVAAGGDAVLLEEADDDRFLDHPFLHVDAEGLIWADKKQLGHIDAVLTGRVFSANGPWVVVEDKTLRALLPNMLAHRQNELGYYQQLLTALANAGGYQLQMHENPAAWEGMADVVVLGEQLVLTYTVKGHYDAGCAPKTLRSSWQGGTQAANFAGVAEECRLFVELRYPHFHGDTVHFAARPPSGPPLLFHYAGGLYENSAHVLPANLGDRIVTIDQHDAVVEYAGNSRQVHNDVLVPAGVSHNFRQDLEEKGLPTRPLQLNELFGKGGGGPACATLYLPQNLHIPAASKLRFTQLRTKLLERRERLAQRVQVEADFFARRARG